MKKTIIALMMVATLGAVASAQNTTASLALTGTVAEVVNLAIDTTTATLDLTTSANESTIATLTETSNVRAGYTIEVSSTGSFQLSTGTSNLAYTLFYAGAVVNDPNTGLQSFASGTLASPGSTTKAIAISYTVPPEGLFAGTYSDDLTFTITAN